MQFKKILSVILTGALAFSLAACSGKTNSGPTPQPSTTETTKEPLQLDSAMEAYYVTADWLMNNQESVILIDATPDKGYNGGHIPGAINVTWQSLSNMVVKQGEPNWGVILEKDALAKKLGSLGIDGSKTIVIYNDPAGLGEEGRVLWTMHMAGIQNAKMLYGGLPAWKAAGGETTKEVPEITPVTCTIDQMDNTLIATTDYVKEHQKEIKLIDTRSPEEYQGKSNHGENYNGQKALGRIPGAIALHYQDLYTIDGTPKNIEDMKKIFDDLGLKPEDEIVTYCTVGIRSGFTAEMLRMCGYSKAKNYNGSFSEWAGSGLPIEK